MMEMERNAPKAEARQRAAAVNDEAEVTRAVQQYADMVRRICLCYLHNEADSQDIGQEVFLKYLRRNEPFESSEQEKAWLIRVTINECKDLFRRRRRHPTVPLELIGEIPTVDSGHSEVLQALLGLPEPYREVLYLHYAEGYSALEIAGMLHRRENTVYSLLHRGREMLKEKLGGNGIDDE
jgi:RNA polymerase sigma-70 factor (ECF subfamily)